MLLKPGTRLRSAVCATEIIVVRAPGQDVELSCGGAPLAPIGADAPAAELDAAHAGGTRLGKRYADEELGLEVLCTKPGDGSLSVAGSPLAEKDAKPLPASD